jgi:Trypsin-like peptidase domain
MDLRQVLADEPLRAELLDRLDEVVAAAPTGFERFDGGLARSTLSNDINRVAEGRADGTEYDGLEAIVLAFTRPVFFIQNATFVLTAAGSPESEVLADRLSQARSGLDAATASVGRVELSNHRLGWAGTAWMVAEDIAVTNRHVAEYFAAPSDTGFGFRLTTHNQVVHASLDWRREYGQPEESVAQVSEVLWMEPDGSFDVALLRVRGIDGQPLPPPIELMTHDEIKSGLNQWIAVIGYPQRSLDNSLEDQQRIFDGIYGVKRLAPGTVMSIAPDGLFDHDATTLGGNSGSVVVDLGSGKATGLHFGGFEGDRNMAVQGDIVADLLSRHA